MTVPEWMTDAQARYDKATPGRWRTWAMSVMAGPFDNPDHALHVEVAHTLYLDDHGRPRTVDADFIAAAHQDLPRALGALRAVLELHQYPDGDDPAKTYCAHDDNPWPCPTARLVLNAEEAP